MSLLDKNDDSSIGSLPWTGERFVPNLQGNIALEHFHRYVMARELAAGKSVLDIACGEGYGSALLAQVAKNVIGVDISREAVAHATLKYTAPNIEFKIGSCTEIPLADSSIDLVISFETIEHHDQHEAMMAEIKRVLRPHGVIIMSSPEKYAYSIVPNYSNPFHVKELYRHEFEELMAANFKHVALFGQRIAYGSGVFREGIPEQIGTYSTDTRSPHPSPGMSRPTYLIAVASDAALPPVASSFFEQPVNESEVVLSWAALVAERDGQIVNLNQAVVERDEQIYSLNQGIAEQDRQISTLRLVVKERDNLISSLDQAVAEQNAQLISINQEITERDNLIASLNQEVAEREAQLLSLNQAKAEGDGQITAILSSTSWRLTKPMRLAADQLKRMRRWFRLSPPSFTALRRNFRSAYFLSSNISKVIARQGGIRRAWNTTLRVYRREGLKGIKDRIGHNTQGSDNPFNNRSRVHHSTLVRDNAGEYSLAKLLQDLSVHCSVYGPVGHILALPFFGAGGAELVALNVARAIREIKPNRTVVILLTDNDTIEIHTEVSEGVKLVNLAHYLRERGDHTQKRELLRNLLIALRPDVLHIINSELAWRLLLDEGTRLAGITALYASIFALQYDTNNRRTGYAEYFLRPGLPHLKGLFSDNKRFILDAIREYGVDAVNQRKMHVLYNPSRILNEVSSSRSRMYIQSFASRSPERRLRVLWAGRLDAEKRIDLMLEIVRDSPFADFFVFGRNVVDQKQDLPLLPNLRVMGPFTDPIEMTNAVDFDAFVFTSRWEGMPNILLEIGAIGIPVIAPSVGGVGELICEQTGYLLAERPSVADYQAALQQIARNPKDAAIRAEALLNLIEERHSWSIFVENIKHIPAYLYPEDDHRIEVTK